MEIKDKNISADKIQQKVKFSVIMPCYKGEGFIENSIKTIEKEISLFERDFEVIVVIDGFIDNGYEKAKALEQEYYNLKVVGYEINRGKGHAIIYGLKHCQGEYVAFLDSDLDYHPQALAWFLKIIKEKDADLVTGNRRDKNSTFKYPLIRKLASWWFNIYVNFLFPELKIDDTQAGIKLIRRNCAQELFHHLEDQEGAHGFIYDIYLLVLARKLDLKILQAPCIFTMKSSTIGMRQKFFKSAYNMGKEVWKFKHNFYEKFFCKKSFHNG